MLGAVVHLLVKASLLVDLPVRRHQLRKLLQLLHLLGGQLGGALGLQEVSEESFLLNRGEDLLDSQDVGDLNTKLIC